MRQLQSGFSKHRSTTSTFRTHLLLASLLALLHLQMSRLSQAASASRAGTKQKNGGEDEEVCEIITGSVSDSRVTLNDGNSIPRVGLGVYQSTPGTETYEAVLAALKLGYRHIDTAHLYRNEVDVGRAVRDSGVPREDIFITTKLWAGMGGEPADGFHHAIQSGIESQEKLGTYIDLYLIHSPAWKTQRINAWLGMEELRKRGIVKSIGVSNYGVHHLEELIADSRTTVVPAVNQVEIHLFLQRSELVSACRDRWDIAVEAYSPLAKARRFGDVPQAIKMLRSAETGEALPDNGSSKYPTAAQIMLRWGLQKGFIILPKSVNPKRIAENADVFDWELASDTMTQLQSLDDGFNTGWDPTTWR